MEEFCQESTYFLKAKNFVSMTFLLKMIWQKHTWGKQRINLLKKIGNNLEKNMMIRHGQSYKIIHWKLLIRKIRTKNND